METINYSINGETVTEVRSTGKILCGTRDFLDILGETGSDNILINKENISEEFFKLNTGIAGEIVQKASNYRIRLGIIGDFSEYTSKSLRDFMMESNKSKQILFVESVYDALKIWDTSAGI